MLESLKLRTPRSTASPLSVTATLNQGLPVHDWYLMPEAYSEPLIVDAIRRFSVHPGETILDPFSGTGTTAITSVLRGINAVGLEVNPFLCLASRVKLDWNISVSDFRNVAERLLGEAKPLLDYLTVERNMFTHNTIPEVQEQAEAILAITQEPDMPRLYKWMTKVVVQKILVLDYLIRDLAPSHLQSHFLLALAAILRPASNMKLTAHAFGSNTEKMDAPVYDLMMHKLAKMCNDLEELQSSSDVLGNGQIVHTDARLAKDVLSDLLPASLAFTSPPYLNNLDYTMQTRMELFFLRFVNSMEDLRKLRKTMLICDAKAMYKDVLDSERVEDVQSVQAIAIQLREVHKNKNWGWDYAFMTTQYFGGMIRVLEGTYHLLKPGASFVLVVGDSSHSGVRIPLPEILAELGELSGYELAEINVLRSRRSSSHSDELREAEVILRRP